MILQSFEVLTAQVDNSLTIKKATYSAALVYFLLNKCNEWIKSSTNTLEAFNGFIELFSPLTIGGNYMTNSKSHNITKSHYTHLRSACQSQPHTCRHTLTHTCAFTLTLSQLLTSHLILPELVHPIRIKTYQVRRLAKFIYYDRTRGQNTDCSSAVFPKSLIKLNSSIYHYCDCLFSKSWINFITQS